MEVLYLQLPDRWLRMFLDEGVLFLEESGGPDASEDLGGGRRYVDLGVELGLQGKEIVRMAMEDMVFELRCEGGARLVLKEENESTMLRHV